MSELKQFRLLNLWLNEENSMKYRLKHLSIFLIAALLAVVGVVAQQGGFSGAGLPQFGESWLGYKIGLPLFSIIALLNLVKAVRGQQQTKQAK